MLQEKEKNHENYHDVAKPISSSGAHLKLHKIETFQSCSKIGAYLTIHSRSGSYFSGQMAVTWIETDPKGPICTESATISRVIKPSKVCKLN